MIQCRELTFIKTLKATLLVVIGLIALSQVYFGGLQAIENLEKLNTWNRQPAEIASLGNDNEVEVIVASEFADAVPDQEKPKYCVARDEATSCLLLYADPYAWLSVFDQVELLQNPQQPSQLAIGSASGFWLPVLGHCLTLLLLATVWRWLTHYSLWGKDVTWLNGVWIETTTSPMRIGLNAMDAEPITEAPGSRKAVIFWLILFTVIAALVVPGFQTDDANDPLTILYPIAALGMLSLALYTLAKTYSRTIYQERTGLIDSSLFGIKRVPWSAIAEVKRVNLNQDAQRSYDRHHEFSDTRPDTLNIYKVMDQQGRTILRLSENMSPALAFSALLSRLRRSLTAVEDTVTTNTSRAFIQRDIAEQRDHENDDDFEAEARRMMGLTQSPRKSLFHRENRSILIGLVLMLAPFVLLTSFLAYKSLWFQVAAMRSEGLVIEIKQDGVPSLIVEYKTPQGKSFTTRSDGSSGYENYRVGDRVTVFYDAEDPENARIDLFLELWLGTILMGGLTCIVMLATVLIGRGLMTPMHVPMK